MRAVVITGAGRAFSSGADLKELNVDMTPEGRPNVYRTLTERYHPIMTGVRELPKPVIAAVNGPAVGIGCSLALCCDLIIAGEGAYFLLAFVNIGLVPDGGSSLFLPTRLGMARATELAMLGERLSAAAGIASGASSTAWSPTTSFQPRRPRSPRAWRRVRRAPTRAPSASSTTGSTAAWTSSSSSRRASSRRWPRAPISWRARWRSPRSARPASPAASCTWQTPSSASRPRLNRIPAALGHAIPQTLAFFTPQSGGSPNANQIASLYKITLYIALVIFVLVEGALIYALIKFRARKGVVAAQIRGNTRLEIGWTTAAAVILLALAIVTFAKLSSIQNPPNSGPEGATLASDKGPLYASAERKLPPNGKALPITVIGRQYLWQYVYPGASEPDGLGAPYSYETMVVPTNTTVSLDIVSADVVHAWWIPQLGGKFQAVPGYHNYTWFKISKPGLYHGQCAFLCGRAHARMIATVQAVPPAQFEAWLARQKLLIAKANAEARIARAKLGAQTGAGAVENP